MVKSHNFLAKRFTGIKQFLCDFLSALSDECTESQSDLSLFSLDDKVFHAVDENLRCGNASNRPFVFRSVISLARLASRLSVSAKVVLAPNDEAGIAVANANFKSVASVRGWVGTVTGEVDSDSTFAVDVSCQSRPVDFTRNFHAIDFSMVGA